MKQFFQFVCGDFEAAWNALAGEPRATHRGNLMFAVLTGLLIEGALEDGLDVAAGLMLTNPRYGEFPELLGYLQSPRLVYAERPIIGVDGETLDVGLTGAMPGRFLDPNEQPPNHMTRPDPDRRLYVRTDRLYLDVKELLRKEGRL